MFFKKNTAVKGDYRENYLSPSLGVCRTLSTHNVDIYIHPQELRKIYSNIMHKALILSLSFYLFYANFAIKSIY